jgi:radical SAM-linked protein
LIDNSFHSKYSELLSRIRQPARLIGNELGAGRGFSGEDVELRVALAFPDTYEIGISNQALQILYHLADRMPGVGVERTYLPWVDAIAEMRRTALPLLTLETWSPVVFADMLGITLQHEFSYTNVLELLDLASIELLAADRGPDEPLVIGGGPAVANFLPVAPFFDAFAVGEGEQLFPAILEALREAKLRGVSRERAKLSLSSIDGVYVPGVSRGVTRRVVSRLEKAPYPASCLVPLTAGVHDRAWVEVMRGCSRGCRFCQAGMWYRPVRERSPESVMQMVSDQLTATGHEELSLASLSTTDYSRLEDLLSALAAEHPETKVALPSLRVDSTAVRLAHLLSPTGPSITLAPEAGSQRMRDIINKNVDDEDIMSAVEEAFRCGHTTIKLYFVIGFPMETDDDVSEIADLCLRIRETGRRVLGPKANRLQMSISVNNFVPKPFTPFQWEGMADRETLRRRQELLRSRLRKPGVRVTLHQADKSYLEAALARGGEDMSRVILEAWRLGARFDSWTEQYCSQAWKDALESAGTTAETLATTSFAHDAELPWDIIQGVVEKQFLADEFALAVTGQATLDCREAGCTDCGACSPGIDIDLAPASAVPKSAVGVRAARMSMGDAAGPEAQAAVAPAQEAVTHRYLLTFSVSGKMRFVGHLDKMELLRRAVRRSGGRLALSAGMRPKPLLSLAIPLGVGVEADAELCEFALSREAPDDFAERLAAALPDGLGVCRLEPYHHPRHAASRVTHVEYRVAVGARSEADLPGVLQHAAEEFTAASELIRQEEREDRIRTFDLKAFVKEVAIDVMADEADSVSSPQPGENRATMTFLAAMTPSGSARPQRVVEAMSDLAGVQLKAIHMVRTRIVLG